MAKPPRLRRRPRTAGQWAALALAIAVHVAFIAVLVVSIRWQNRTEAPVTAELYAPAIEAVTPAPEPQVKVPEPAPPAPAPSPPVAEAPPKPAAPVPDIAQKAKEEEERKKAELKRREAEKREAEKKLAEKKRVEEKKAAETRERQAREIAALTAQAGREQQAQADARARAQAEALAAERARAEADWIRRIQAKVKGVWNPPPELSGNPEAVFDVVQLPTGEIIDVRLRKSSGISAYDESVQRAILKASPLPRPERADLFQRSLSLRFRPQD